MKNKTLEYAVLGILLILILISVIVFVIPTEKTGTFWIAYVFTVLAFVTQIAIWEKAFRGKSVLKSKFLSLPIVYVGIVYLIVRMIAFAIFIVTPTLPTWSVIMVCVAIVGIFIVCMFAGKVGQNEINRMQGKMRKRVIFIKKLQMDLELLADVETNTRTKIALQQLAEKIRFSDPMNNDTLVEIEEIIVKKVVELKTASDKLAIIQELNLLLADRNEKAKLLK